jgi:hypothetical protein
LSGINLHRLDQSGNYSFRYKDPSHDGWWSKAAAGRAEKEGSFRNSPARLFNNSRDRSIMTKEERKRRSSSIESLMLEDNKGDGNHSEVCFPHNEVSFD